MKNSQRKRKKKKNDMPYVRGSKMKTLKPLV